MADHSTVRTVTYGLLRDLRMTTIIGNPWSSAEPFLAEFTDGFLSVPIDEGAQPWTARPRERTVSAKPPRTQHG